jgi:hypothetical protein
MIERPPSSLFTCKGTEKKVYVLVGLFGKGRQRMNMERMKQRRLYNNAVKGPIYFLIRIISSRYKAIV